MAVALLFAGSALLFSCKEEPKAAEESLDGIKTEQSQNLTIVVSENGRRSYRFTTPLLEGYTLGRDPYREFRKGIKITTYQDDSLTTVNATLESNYAIYYENRKLWEAKGNVRIVKNDGTKVYTQQLFWNSVTKRIYSNVDTKIVTANDTHFAEGFESDEDLVELNFRHWKGKVKMQEQMLQEKNDSTAVDVEKQPEPQSKPAQSISKPKKVNSVQRPQMAPKRRDSQIQRNSANRADKTTTQRIR